MLCGSVVKVIPTPILQVSKLESVGGRVPGTRIDR